MNPQGALEHVLGNVLGYPQDHQVRLAFAYFGVNEINAFTLFKDDDFTLPYYIPDPEDNTKQIQTRLVHVYAKRLNALITWFYSQPNQKLATWYNLTADSFQEWYDATKSAEYTQPDVETDIPTTPPTSSSRTFRSNIKITMTDYPKLKEDKHWRTYNRLLKATAAAHDTLQVLDHTYVPTETDEQETFAQKQYFMYNVFTQTLNTSKGKLCVRAHELTRDAQMVYCELNASYNDELSATLSATTLRNELTLLLMDDKWRSGYEHFLNLWTTKIQDLESIEDSAVSDSTKRIWLTATLQGNVEMRSAIRQAQTTQLTLHGMDSKSTPPSWTSFYNMLLCTAKLLDKEKTETAKTQRRVHHTENTRTNTTRPNQRGGRSPTTRPGRGTPGRGNHHNTTTQRQFTKYTGPSMTMRVENIFSRADWPKLTPNQRNTLIALKAKAKEGNNPTNTNPPTRLVNAHVTVPSCDNTSVATDLSGPSICQVLSQQHITTTPTNNITPTVFSLGNGHTLSINSHIIKYSISQHQLSPNLGSLIDGGANGGVSGSDVLLLDTSQNHAELTGLGGEQAIKGVPICTVAGLIQTQNGPVIGIFNQYAHSGKGHTVHSVNQMKHFGMIVDDVPLSLSGKQCIITPDGYHIPLSIRQGLPWMDMSQPTLSDMDSYPHVMFTADMPWDPQVHDHEYNIHELPPLNADQLDPAYHPDTLNNYGELTTYHINQHTWNVLPVDIADAYHYGELDFTRNVNYHNVKPKQHEFAFLQTYFSFVPVERIRHTLNHTTQFARMDPRLPLRKHYKTRFPAANVSRLNETVATDTFFSDIPAFADGILGHGGSTMLQLYCGCNSHLIAVFPMKTDHEMAHTLEDFIRTYGAPNALFSDNAKAQIGKTVRHILRMYAIKDFRCEPHHQHQNFAERQIQEVKKRCNALMDRSGALASYWLLCTNYAVYQPPIFRQSPTTDTNRSCHRTTTRHLGHPCLPLVSTSLLPFHQSILPFTHPRTIRTSCWLCRTSW